MSILSLADAGRYVLDLVYPPSCALCGKGGAFLCAGCEAGLPRAMGDRCGRCWLPLTDGHCHACDEHEPAFEALRCCFRYEAGVHDLIHAYKFKRQSSLAEPLGRLTAELVDEHNFYADAIVPVPLRTMRQRDRGYNQAALLATNAGKLLDMPVFEALQRRGTSEAQARASTAVQRRLNVEGAFSLRRNKRVESLTLLLVDDVATTGSTLDACARVLLEAGALSVFAVTLARDD